MMHEIISIYNVRVDETMDTCVRYTHNTCTLPAGVIWIA